MNEPVFLKGHTISLRPTLDSDILETEWHHWYNDYTITKFNSHGVFPISRSEELEFIKELRGQKDSITLTIVQNGTGKVVGNVALQRIDLIARRSNIALTIGDPFSISVGVEAFGLLLQHAFDRLNLNRVGDATHEGLSVFVKMLSVLGMQEEGRWRQFFLRNGEYHDAVLFGVLASEFNQLREERGGNILFDSVDKLQEELVKCVRSSVQSI